MFRSIFAFLYIASLARASDIFNYNDTKIRGVALGGWLVLEPYITPSIFESAGNLTGSTPVDEYHLTSVLRDYNQTEVMEEHWSTFYNESDFEQIADAGLNLVRIPIGYWAFQLVDNDTYIQGQEDYLDLALEWAAKYSLNVWIDLHGVPGSQNGFDNSGLRDHIDWQKKEEYLNVTNEVLYYIFDKYASDTETVAGIEIVNEPYGSKLNMTKIKDYYVAAYEQLDNQNNMVMHDAFQSIGYWNEFFEDPSGDDSPAMEDIVLDHHHYEVFSNGQLNYTIEEHVQSVVNYGKSINDSESETVDALVGEWSAALTDCVYWLNGVGTGSRFEATYENDVVIGSCAGAQDFASWSETYKNDTRLFVEAQIFGYEQTSGWIFWCWKTETTIDWDLQRLIKYELFPQPLNNFTTDIQEYLKDGDSDDDDGTIEFSSSNGVAQLTAPTTLSLALTSLIPLLLLYTQ